MNAVLLICALLGQGWSQPLVTFSRDALALPDQAYVVLPPVAIASDVQELQWSPSGKLLLLRTSDASVDIQAAADSIRGKVEFEGEEEPFNVPQANLGVYAPSTGNVRWAINFTKDVVIDAMHWTSNGTALVEVTRYLREEKTWSDKQELAFFSVVSGRVAPLEGAKPDGDFLQILTDPETGLTLIVTDNFVSSNSVKSEAFVLDTAGRVAPAPPPVREALEQEWRAVQVVPGRGIVFVKQAGVGMAMRLLNSRLTFDPWSEELQGPKPATTPGVLAHVEGALGDNLILAANQAQSSVAPVVICQQVELSSLSPHFDSVAYTSQRTLWIRAIVPMASAELQRRLVHEREMEVRRNAQMVAYGLLSYLAEHDDQFPTGDPASAIRPYLTKKSAADGFIFTIPNVRGYEDLKDPPATELGYFKGEGGRTVVYADSSVKWVPDK